MTFSFSFPFPPPPAYCCRLRSPDSFGRDEMTTVINSIWGSAGQCKCLKSFFLFMIFKWTNISYDSPHKHCTTQPPMWIQWCTHAVYRSIIYPLKLLPWSKYKSRAIMDSPLCLCACSSVCTVRKISHDSAHGGKWNPRIILVWTSTTDYLLE